MSGINLPIFSVGALTLTNLLPALLVLVLCLIVKKILMRFFDRGASMLKIDSTLIHFLRSTVNIGLYLLIVLIVADKLGIPMASLIAVLSVAGLSISLAIQGTLSNLAGGIMILLSKPFLAGDYIEAGEISGTVRQIGLVYTILATVDNKLINVPNGQIASAKIINYTTEPNRRIDLTFSASYDSPIGTVKEALLAAAARFPAVLSDPEPFANVLEYHESQINYTLRIWVKNDDFWPTRFALLEAVKEEFDRHGVVMSYPHLNVHLVEKGT